ncbi:amidohydrolase family protein [Pyxidicoccus sp. 3LG]
MTRFLRRSAIILLAAGVLVFAAVNLAALPELADLPAPARNSMTVLSGVSVVDPRGTGSIATDQMVIVTGERISFVGPSGSRPIPAGATVLSLEGRFVIPGLWDSHVHTLRLSPQLHFPLLIANGVTSVRDMGDTCSWSGEPGCESETRRWRARIQGGEVTGPRLIETTSYHLESVPESDAELEQLLDTLKGRGERFLKLQLESPVSPGDFSRVTRVAHDRKLAVAGHFPSSIDVAEQEHPLETIEHDWSLLPQCSDARAGFDGRNRSKAALLAGMSEPRCRRVLERLAGLGTAYVPTHIASTGQDAAFARGESSPVAELTRRYVVAPQRWLWALLRSAGEVSLEEQKLLGDVHQAALRLTGEAHAAGVTILAGTDALDADVIHGFSLHQELEHLVSAGLTPAEALFSATLAPARRFGREGQLGTIEEGKLADLVVLEGDPLLDIRNTRRIHTVVADGRFHGEAERAGALRFVEEQSHRVSVVCRYLRGLWFGG